MAFFDLRESFLQNYFKEHKIHDPDVQSQVRKQYPNCGYLHTEEKEWIEANGQEVYNKLLSTNADIVVFDELDHIRKEKLCPEKENTVLQLIGIAAQLKNKGKKVVFVMHRQCLASEEVWEELQERFHVIQENLIRAKYFTETEEKALLGKTLLSTTDRDKFIKWVMGDPTAYKALLKRMIACDDKNSQIEVSFDKLADEAIDQVTEIWKNARSNQPEWVLNALVNIAKGEVILEQAFEKDEIEVLFSTGMIGARAGQEFMPTIVKDVILAFPMEKK